MICVLKSKISSLTCSGLLFVCFRLCCAVLTITTMIMCIQNSTLLLQQCAKVSTCYTKYGLFSSILYFKFGSILNYPKVIIPLLLMNVSLNHLRSENAEMLLLFAWINDGLAMPSESSSSTSISLFPRLCSIPEFRLLL